MLVFRASYGNLSGLFDPHGYEPYGKLRTSEPRYKNEPIVASPTSEPLFSVFPLFSERDSADIISSVVLKIDQKWNAYD